MNRFVLPSAILAMLVLAARPASATPLDLILKCGNPNGAVVPVAFVPVREVVEGAEYTPQVLLQPRSAAWNLVAKREVPTTPPPPPKPLVFLLDGRIVDEDAFGAATSEIEGIHFACSDAVHETLGIEPGHTLVVAFTYPMRQMLRKEMDAIEAMQADFVQVNGRFARSLEELAWTATEDTWLIELTASEDGSAWEAAGRHILLDERDSVRVSGTRAAES